MRSTKIVATLGPATDPPATLRRLFEAGVNVFRLNASHSTWDQHCARIQAVREAAASMGVYAGVLLDLQGPKIRLGEFPSGGCDLVTGTDFTITTEAVLGTATLASSTYAPLAREVTPGDRVLLADGAVELEALSTTTAAVTFRVVSGGPISSHKGINLPGVKLSTPSMTPKDADDLERGLDMDVDFVALSFVRNANDVYSLRRRLEERDSHAVLIAKIEKPEAWVNIEAILDASDGVMVARGDLGVEMPLEKVPFIQKRVIQRARQKGKFVITATQMLESMIENARPTRAEVSDVANAICDGTDAVMLSAETSVGAACRWIRADDVDHRGRDRRMAASERLPRSPAPRHTVKRGDRRRSRVPSRPIRGRGGHRGLHHQRFQRAFDFPMAATGADLCVHTERKGRAPTGVVLRRASYIGARGFDYRRDAASNGTHTLESRTSAPRRQCGVRRGPAHR